MLEKLEPQEVWTYFTEILKIPRPSRKEEKIRQFLLDFGNKHGLHTSKDSIGNVLISKPATPGYERRKPIILQSHMDMVCEKNNDVEFNFETDPIRAIVDGDWVTADGTTLGADDGIGIAAQMAVLASKTIKHGPLECLFTVDEETGLTGAHSLEPGFLKGKTLLNLDSEDEGELFIGCAGGIDTLASFTYKKSKAPKGSIAFKLSLTGLKGGHSGDEIDKNLGNSNKLLCRLLWNAASRFKLRLSYFDGGNLRNAIPREAFALICIKSKHRDAFLNYVRTYTCAISKEYEVTEPGLSLKAEEAELPEYVMGKKSQWRLLNALYACPHGVHAMSTRMPGMVETSTNLASVKFEGDNKILVTTSQRSDSETAKHDIASMVESAFLLADARVMHTEGYPGWAPNPDSEILKVTVKAYERLFGKKAEVKSIHAGLECGLFLEKYPDMDMISFGPTLRAVHSPDEKIHIGTVGKFWKLLVEVLENVPMA